MPFPPHSLRNASYFDATPLNWLTSVPPMGQTLACLLSENPLPARLSKSASSTKLTSFHHTILESVAHIPTLCIFIHGKPELCPEKVPDEACSDISPCLIAWHFEFRFSNQKTGDLILNSIFQVSEILLNL